MHILLYLKVIQTQRLVLIFASLILKEYTYEKTNDWRKCRHRMACLG